MKMPTFSHSESAACIFFYFTSPNASRLVIGWCNAT